MITKHIGENYYSKQKTWMMKEFSAIFKGGLYELRIYFDEPGIKSLREKCEVEYLNLFPNLPFVGGKKSINTINIIMGAVTLALIISMEKNGLKRHQIGKIIFEAYKGYFNLKPEPLRLLIGRISSSKLYIKKMKKQIEKNSLQKYEGDFLMENIEIEGDDCDFGYNFIRCPLSSLFNLYGKSDYLRYVCLGDFVLFRSYGIGFSRTRTIGNGAETCDFRFKKGTGTANGWPPEKLDEWTGGL